MSTDVWSAAPASMRTNSGRSHLRLRSCTLKRGPTFSFSSGCRPMLQVLIVIHLLLALAMVGVILLQRSEGGALGIGGGGGGFMTGRRAGNALTQTTTILAARFF